MDTQVISLWRDKSLNEYVHLEHKGYFQVIDHKLYKLFCDCMVYGTIISEQSFNSFSKKMNEIKPYKNNGDPGLIKYCPKCGSKNIYIDIDFQGIHCICFNCKNNDEKYSWEW